MAACCSLLLRLVLQGAGDEVNGVGAAVRDAALVEPIFTHDALQLNALDGVAVAAEANGELGLLEQPVEVRIADDTSACTPRRPAPDVVIDGARRAAAAATSLA